MTADKPRTTAYAYIRTASKNGLNDERQIKAINRFANLNNVRIIAMYSDKGTPGFGLKHTGLRQLLSAAITEPTDYVLVYDSARISRSVEDFNTILNLLTGIGVSIKTVGNSHDSQTPSELFAEYVLQYSIGEINSYERTEMIKKRMRARAEAGYSIQRPPLGYERSSTPGIFIKNEMAGVLAYYFKQTLKGELSQADLKKAISQLSHKSIDSRRLKILVSNPYYSGYINYAGNLSKGLHEPLITSEEQRRLIELVA